MGPVAHKARPQGKHANHYTNGEYIPVYMYTY